MGARISLEIIVLPAWELSFTRLGEGLTFGIGEVQGSLLERWWLPFWTQSLQRFSFIRASRSHAKTGLFLCLEIGVLPACQLTLTPFSRK